ncbi:MAG: hypothetical protein CMM52_12125 [Rhodospirillaceae bacterium]|nr:hypothetical protein [Rhodospirillaceae bacterium]|tara:strand:- start:472 stop:1302 length:831 start_codon:yes stop_codon:yes gene_type:complete
MYRFALSALASALLFIVIAVSPTKRANALTFVIDFDPVAQFSFNTTPMSAFDVTPYGLTAGQRNTVISSIMTELKNDFHNIVSPSIPVGMQLDVDFVQGAFGDLGATAGGDSEYYYIVVGEANNISEPLGEAFTDGVSAFGAGAVLGAVYTDNIFTDVFNGLGTPGDLSEITHVINGTLAHEIAHTVNLQHCAVAGSVTPTGLNPIMATGAIDLPNAARLLDREFGSSCTVPSVGTQNSIQVLVNEIGLREIPEPASIALLALGLVGFRFMRYRAN